MSSFDRGIRGIRTIHLSLQLSEQTLAEVVKGLTGKEVRIRSLHGLKLGYTYSYVLKDGVCKFLTLTIVTSLSRT